MAGERPSFNLWRLNFSPSGGQGERRGGNSAVSEEPKPVETQTPTIPRESSPTPKNKGKISREYNAAIGILFDIDRLAPPPTKKDIEASNGLHPSWDTKLADKVGGKWPGRIAAASGVAFAGVAAYVGNEIYKNSALHERVESFSNTFTDTTLIPDAETSKVNPDERFDNKARSGEIKTIKRIPQEEVEALDSFAKIDDHNTVLAIHPLDLSTSNKPDAKIKYKRGNSNNVYVQDGIDREAEGYYSLFIFEKVPAGSTILAPVDGRLFVFREKDSTNDHPFSKAVIEFQPREGEIFVIMIGGRSTSGGGMMNPPRSDVFRSLTDAPAYESSPVKSDNSPSILEVIEQAIPIKKGQPIMQSVMETNVGFEVNFSARPNTDPGKFKKVGETSVDGQKRDVVQAPATHLKLLLSEDGEIVQPELKTPQSTN